MISASARARAPGSEAGAVVPIVGIARNPTGIPASARTSAPSMPSLSWVRGAIVHTTREKGGRRRISSRLPAITVAISRA
jgi:hypothetical protein